MLGQDTAARGYTGVVQDTGRDSKVKLAIIASLWLAEVHRLLRQQGQRE